MESALWSPIEEINAASNDHQCESKTPGGNSAAMREVMDIENQQEPKASQLLKRSYFTSQRINFNRELHELEKSSSSTIYC